MNSKEDRNKRPGGTYTLDTNGNVVKSRGLENFNGADVVEFKKELTARSPSSSVSLLSLSSQSCVFDDFSLSSISLEDELKDADDLMHEIDEMLEDEKRCKTDRKSSGLECTLHGNTPTNNIASKHNLFPVTMTERLKSIAQKNMNLSEEIKAEDIEDDVQSFRPDIIEDDIKQCVNPMPTLQDGLMAVRLPPIDNNIQLEDIFQKMVKDEDILHAADLAPAKDNGVEIEVDTESRNSKMGGLRKYLCGLCGECGSSQKEEKKKTTNCLQRIWKRVKQIF